MKTVRFGIIGCGLMGREIASAAARWCHLTEMPARPEIVAIIRSLPVLGDKDKERRMAYLDQFFRAAGKPDRLLKRFENRCLD